jgi:hypothetical protein
MESLLSIVVGFVLTGLIGNRLVQTWQARNWLLQQRFLGQEKEYVGLKELADEIVSLLSVRIYHMRRLNRAIATGVDEDVVSNLKEYDDILKRWNERLPSFYIRLTMLADYDLALRLEDSIQADLVRVGADIEYLTAKHKIGASINKNQSSRIVSDLNKIQGSSISFNKHLLNVLHSRRVDVYFGKRIPFSPENLQHFSSWQLVKALFIRDVNSLSVVRAPSDS